MKDTGRHRKGQAEGEQREQLAQSAAAVAWRTQYLQQAGFSPRLADAVAADPGYDVHAVIELVGHGCPPELAARIMAPLGFDGP